MNDVQKRNLRIIAVIGALYFLLFIFPNAETMGSDNPKVFLHTDEYVTYPIVERMLQFGPGLSENWGRLIIYRDYHYGYPFYFLSMLALLPLRLIKGTAFFDQTALNILVLRQMISVLPMILTAGVLTYTLTRFRKLWASLFTFLFILTIPEVVRGNMHWWHPDALLLLSIALTFFFLDRDAFRLGRNFLFAAAACGMAVAVKLMGFFFFLAVPVYLLIAWRKNKIPLKKVLTCAVLFVIVMAAVIILSNPFLFYEVPRQEMIAIQSKEFETIEKGYTHERSLYYSLGPQYWTWTLSTSYGGPNFPLLLLAMLILGSAVSKTREKYWVLLAWLIPTGIYLLWFVAPKPGHYLLPLLIPLYSTVLVGFDVLAAGWDSQMRWLRWIGYFGSALFLLVVLAQCIFHITTDIPLYSAYFTSN